MKIEDFIDMMMAETKAAIKDVKEKNQGNGGIKNEEMSGMRREP